jgi:hypothetical protein
VTTTRHGRGPATSPPVAGPSRIRARYGAVYGYHLRDPATGGVRCDDYVGQARDPTRRDKQHRGELPQRDGQVREQPWSDLIVGWRILEQGVWTDAELDARERNWIAACRPRMNMVDNESNPNRIPIYEQRRQRDQRDAARGLPARDWRRIPAQRTVVLLPASVWARVGRWLWQRLRQAMTGR